MHMTRHSTTGHYHHGDLRNALLQATAQLLRERGIDGFSLRDVARAAGVSHAAPYRHFRDKAALLRAVSGLGFERLHAVLAEAAASQRGPEQTLIEVTRVYVQRVVQNPGMTRLMFGAVISAEGDAGNTWAEPSILEVLLGIIKAGLAVGAFRDRDPQELALVAWSAMHGLAMLAVGEVPDVKDRDTQQLDALARSVAENVIYGISRS
jgi:AcrR family transcriptional regulator